MGILVLTLLPPHHAAHAQLSGRLELASDKRLRGVSQSDSKPTWVLSGNEDLDNGLYIGALVSAYPFRARASTLAVQADIGYVHQLGVTHAWDAGLLTYRFKNTDHDPSYNYTEYFVGISGKSWASHVYTSPNYLGTGGQSVYVEVNVAQSAVEHITWTAHAGVLHRFTTPWLPALTREDLRAGLMYQWPLFAVELALVTTLPTRGTCEPGADACRGTAVVSLFTAF